MRKSFWRQIERQIFEGGNHEKVCVEHPGGALHGALLRPDGGVRRRHADDHQHRRGGGNTDASPDYKIEDKSIKLLKRDVTYVLTGKTDKKISVWGSNNPEEIEQAFHIVANNVTVNGGIVVENSPVKWCWKFRKLRSIQSAK